MKLFSYFTENYTDIPPDGMMCTNVSMWSAVYWTPENVSVCACEIETKEEVEMNEVLPITVKSRVLHTDPICQIFSKNSFNGKIASKLFKFE